MKKLHLLHLANFNSTNIGNGALISGTENLFKEDMPVETRWTREPWDDYTFNVKEFDRAFVNHLNSSDGMIVNGAVTFNGREYLSQSGMRFDLPFELLNEIKKPLIFYGVSHRYWKGHTFHHADKLKRALNYIIDHPKMIFAVRNDGTREFLSELLQINGHRIQVIPDPGLFVSFQKQIYPEIDPKKINVILSLNNEDSLQRFGSKEVRTTILKRLVEGVERLSKSINMNLILIPHYWDDYDAIGEFISLCKPRFAHQLIRSTGILGVPFTETFYGRYAASDLVISMRIHSLSPAIGLGIPVIALSTQSRIDCFLENAQLQGIALDAFDPALSDKLFNLALSHLNNTESIKSKLQEARSAFREDFRLFNKTVWDKLSSPQA